MRRSILRGRLSGLVWVKGGFEHSLRECFQWFEAGVFRCAMSVLGHEQTL